MAKTAAQKPRTKYVLDDKDIPAKWYNIQADLKTPAPPVLHPGTGQPIGPQDLAPLFPMELIKQEVSRERWIEIPEEIRSVLALWRPSPLYRARRLEKALGTSARIYYKYEGVSPAGSHKPNTAVAQVYYNKREGVTRIATETGAGQWGSALAMATTFFGLQCKVYMVKVSYQQKPYRRIMMETWGAQVVPSPSPDTQAGTKVLAQDPDSPGSLGIAISEAVEDAATRDDTKYSLGSVLNHVLMHQTVIGLEAKKQLERADDEADVVIGCAGGGSNFAGLSFPFAADKLTGKKKKLRIVAVEPAACPSLTKGQYVYDFGDTVGLTPLVKMHTLGHTFVPAPLHAGGLRYHGMAPLVCKLYDEGVIEAVAVPQIATFQAAMTFARAEGIIPAPESAHAIRVAIDEAERCKREGKRQAILFNLSGHGHFDLGAYEAYLAGKLSDYEYPAEKIAEALRSVPNVRG
ncbi:MAG: TrpB-like pyridoxal phosphate-dependent enzyme [Candidatus Rokubacteria bacterium]|nr:TrpB-like pyridoxal phosphate-dependent enzyme [Candidatus Rokubacteria bacterium]